MSRADADAYELAAKWHDKHARGASEIADDIRVGESIQAKARYAASHHAASAAGLRNLAYKLRREAIEADRFESGNGAWAASFAA